MPGSLTRDRLAVLAGVAAPLALAAVLVPFRVGEVFPPDADVELLVEGGGIFQGRFLMTPGPGAPHALERRLLAVAFADQVGAALASSHPVGQS